MLFRIIITILISRRARAMVRHALGIRLWPLKLLSDKIHYHHNAVPPPYEEARRP